MRRAAILLSCFIAVYGALVPAASASKRVAFVVGIDNYDNLPEREQLKNAVNDAHALGEVLQSLGYQVVEADNVDRRSFNANWQKFLSSVGFGDETAFFFAGHGIEIDGQNYLLPRDAPKPQSGEASLVKNESLSLSELMDDLRAEGPRVSLIILDACRDNPFAADGTRSVGGTRGLARVEPPEGTFVMYSAAAGQAALDRLSSSDDNANSVFTRTLVPLIKTPGLPLQEVALRVREKVVELAKSAGHKQTPAYYDQVIGHFCVAGCEIKAVTAKQSQIAPGGASETDPFAAFPIIRQPPGVAPGNASKQLQPSGVQPSGDRADLRQPLDFSAQAVPAIDLSKLRFSDINEIAPGFMRIIISNIGEIDVEEITIGYRAARSSDSCSPNLEAYDGVKKIRRNLSSGDSITLIEQFSTLAKQFCIVSAR